MFIPILFKISSRLPDVPKELFIPINLIGIGLIAAKAKVPIVPAFIKGSNKALPLNSKLIQPKKIRIYFGKPFWPEEFGQKFKKTELYQAIAEMTMQRIAQLKEVSNSTLK